MLLGPVRVTRWWAGLPKFWLARRTAPPNSRQRSSAETAYWTFEPTELMRQLETAPEGVSPAEAARRLEIHGPNALRAQRELTRLTTLARQFQSPLLLLLVFAAGASALSGEWIDAAIVVTIVVATVLIGYSREYSAQSAAAALRARLRVRSLVVREGATSEEPSEEIVPGDIVILAAGSLVPADGVLLEAHDFFVNQAVLTGESFPVQKTPGVIRDPRLPMVERTSCVFLGSNVRSGTARCVVVATGPATEFDAIARRLLLRAPETEFDRGIRRFGYLLTSAMLIMVLLVFVAHVFMGRAPVETLWLAKACWCGGSTPSKTSAA